MSLRHGPSAPASSLGRDIDKIGHWDSAQGKGQCSARATQGLEEKKEEGKEEKKEGGDSVMQSSTLF